MGMKRKRDERGRVWRPGVGWCRRRGAAWWALWALLACVGVSRAQMPVHWQEDFEGDLSAWTGRTGDFVLEEGRARTDGKAAKDVLFLMRPVSGAAADDPGALETQGALVAATADFWAAAVRDGLCWQGRFSTAFNPSSTNYFRYYLWLSGWGGGDTLWSDKDTAVQALYFQMGEKGSENRWRLYRQQGTATTLLWSGETVYKKSSGGVYELRWRVGGTASGTADDGDASSEGGGEAVADAPCVAAAWVRPADSALWRPESGAFAWDWTSLLPDSLRNAPLYTGFYACYGTASRATKFAVDYMRLGGGEAEPAPPEEPAPPVVDTLPEEPDLPVADTLPGDGDPEPPVVDTLPEVVVPNPPVVDTLPEEPAPSAVDWRRPPEATALRWSEILFDVESGESKFIEFYNASDTAVAPYYLYVGVVSGESGGAAADAGGEDPTAPSPGHKPPGKVKWSRLCKDTACRIPPGGYVAYCKDAAALSPRYAPCTEQLYTAAAFPTLNASGGRLIWAWLSPGDTVYGEEAVYDKAMHHVLLPSVKGVSLERIGFKTSALRPDNWQSAAMSAGGATPGCPNSQYNGDLEAEERAHGRYFDFTTRLITPNGDGLNDYTEITWNEALQGFSCKAELYDAYGRKMKTLAEEEILPTRGRWVYKGEDDKGLSLRPGVYVWFIRLVHPDGRRKMLRYAFAVC